MKTVSGGRRTGDGEEEHRVRPMCVLRSFASVTVRRPLSAVHSAGGRHAP